MKVTLILILLAVLIGRGESVADGPDGSVDRNTIKPKTRKCNMERYGMCPELDDEDYDDLTSQPEDKLAERIIRIIANVGRMGATQKFIANRLSDLSTRIRNTHNEKQT